MAKGEICNALQICLKTKAIEASAHTQVQEPQLPTQADNTR